MPATLWSYGFGQDHCQSTNGNVATESGIMANENMRKMHSIPSFWTAKNRAVHIFVRVCLEDAEGTVADNALGT